MRAPLTRRPGVLTGLILLACWLGWTATSFAALGTRPVGDTAAVAQLLARLEGSGLPLPAGQPLALRLPSSGCACLDGDATWQQTVLAIEAQGGRAITLPAAFVDGHGYALLVLDHRGQPVYAGPLAMPALYCGQGRAALADWLPDLLSAHTPPLILPPRCSC